MSVAVQHDPAYESVRRERLPQPGCLHSGCTALQLAAACKTLPDGRLW